MNWDALLLSLRVAGIATIILCVVGLLLAVLLARLEFPGRSLAEAVINLPLILPPTVLGYYLLLLLGRGSPLFEWLGLRVIFTWQAAVIASVTVGMPLMVQGSKAAIESVDRALEDAARTLGSSEWEVLTRVTFPLARRGIVAGLVLSFARALGEFGATLMVAGNIPGRTQTMPLAIYDAVQERQYAEANVMVLIMTALALASLLGARRLSRGTR